MFARSVTATSHSSQMSLPYRQTVHRLDDATRPGQTSMRPSAHSAAISASRSVGPGLVVQPNAWSLRDKWSSGRFGRCRSAEDQSRRRVCLDTSRSLAVRKVGCRV
ncbi:unnamed protein product, partial [Protopolystoma xenopodis]